LRRFEIEALKTTLNCIHMEDDHMADVAMTRLRRGYDEASGKLMHYCDRNYAIVAGAAF
jgi:hypothetical protein